MRDRPFRYYIEEGIAKSLMEVVANHEDVIFCTKTKDLIRVQVKPARKGRIWGNGQEKEKLPKYPKRAKIEALGGLKAMLNYLIKLSV